MIFIGSDHAGYELKKEVSAYLKERGESFRDLGDSVNDPEDDYPDYAFAVAEAVTADKEASGILLCGSAQGVCIAANKVNGARAVTSHSPDESRLAREDDDANILCLAGRKQTLDEVKPIIDTFLSTKFSKAERHVRRITKIKEYEDHAR